MNYSGLYAVCIYDLPQDRDAIVEVLVNVFNYHPTDARIRLRRLPGLLPENFSHERATAIAVRMENAGAHAGIVEESGIPDLKHAPVLRHVRCESSGFKIIDIAGNVAETIPWSQLVFLTVGTIPGNSLDHAPRPNIFMSHTDGTPPVGMHQDHHPPVHEFWIATETPDRCFRFQEHEMNFEYLGERIATSGTENCKRLVEDIRKHATQIACTSGLNAYQSGELQAEDRYQSVELFYNFVASQIVVIRGVRKHETDHN